MLGLGIVRVRVRIKSKSGSRLSVRVRVLVMGWGQVWIKVRVSTALATGPCEPPAHAQDSFCPQDPVDISKPGMMLLNNLFGIVPCGLLLLPYGLHHPKSISVFLSLVFRIICLCPGEHAMWGNVFASLTASQWLVILISCVNGLAISYAVSCSSGE